MPRKPTVQPDPLQVIVTKDLVIEIRDKETREIGRGKDKEFESTELNFQVLLGLADMLLSNNIKERKEALEYLEAPRAVSKLARYLELCGYEQSDRAMRQHACDIRREWRVCRNAMTDEQLENILNPNR
jgi:hypothetical protein